MKYEELGGIILEGPVLKDPASKYGVLTNIDSYNASKIFYVSPNIKFESKFYEDDDSANVKTFIYKVVYLNDLNPNHETNYDTIKKIDHNWSQLQTDIQNCFNNTTVNTEHTYASIFNGGADDAFTLEHNKSALILWIAQENATNGGHYAYKQLILVDEEAQPKPVAITVSYDGANVQIGDEVDLDYIHAYVIFEDGQSNSLSIKLLDIPGYDKEENRFVMPNHEGENTFTAIYTLEDGTELQSDFIITGIKKLSSISARFLSENFPSVAVGHSVNHNSIEVTAVYSDNTRAIVSGWVFIETDKVSILNGGTLRIYYGGLETEVIVDCYSVNKATLSVIYNGPSVEIGNKFNTDYTTIRIRYYEARTSGNSYDESIDPGECTFEPELISSKDANIIKCTYYSNTLGREVTTNFVINGTTAERIVLSIDAEYKGPQVIVGQSFSLLRVVAKAFFSDGTTADVSNAISSTNSSRLVRTEGINEFEIYYRFNGDTVYDTIIVEGILPESTTDNNYYAIDLDNNYPFGQRENNRYRGPAEAAKHSNMAHNIINNFNRLYKIFADIENKFNNVADAFNESSSAKNSTISQCQGINDDIKKWHNVKDYRHAKYIK